MDVKLTKKPIATVTVAGEVDHFNSHRVDAAIRQACQVSAFVILDLSKVHYLDSAGVQLVFLAVQLTRSREGRTAVVVAHEHVKRILEVAAVDLLRNVEVVPSLDAAVATVKRTDNSV